MTGLTLHLDPVPATLRQDAFSRAVGAVAAFYGLSVDLDLPETAGVDLAGVAEVTKAVAAAHQSHFQHRAPGGQFSVRQPHHNLPRDVSTGRYRQRLDAAEREAAVDEARDLIAQFGQRLQVHLGDFTKGRIDADDWYERCRLDVEHWYKLVYREGKRAVGDPAVKLTPQDNAAVNGAVRDELTYLLGFREDLRNKTGTMPWPERMAMYGAAARESFWRGFLLGDQRLVRDIRWTLGPTEHCVDCLRFSAMGWTPIAEFITEVLNDGYAPQSGKLACLGYHCQCSLEERVGGSIQPVPDLKGIVN